MLQYDFVRNSCFLCCAFRYIQHRRRGIQQRDVNAKSRQANRRRSCAAPDIQRTQRLLGLRPGKKILQVGECQVGAQSALGCLKVRGIILRTILESFVDGHGGHLYATLIHARFKRTRSPVQSLAITNA